MGTFFAMRNVAVLLSHPAAEGSMLSRGAGELREHMPELADTVTSA